MEPQFLEFRCWSAWLLELPTGRAIDELTNVAADIPYSASDAIQANKASLKWVQLRSRAWALKMAGILSPHPSLLAVVGMMTTPCHLQQLILVGSGTEIGLGAQGAGQLLDLCLRTLYRLAPGA